MPFALSRQIGGWKTPDPIAHDREKIRILSDISNNFEDNLINFLEDFEDYFLIKNLRGKFSSYCCSETEFSPLIECKN